MTEKTKLNIANLIQHSVPDFSVLNSSFSLQLRHRLQEIKQRCIEGHIKILVWAKSLQEGSRFEIYNVNVGNYN